MENLKKKFDKAEREAFEEWWRGLLETHQRVAPFQDHHDPLNCLFCEGRNDLACYPIPCRSSDGGLPCIPALLDDD